jgi:hypothetical protein
MSTPPLKRFRVTVIEWLALSSPELVGIDPLIFAVLGKSLTDSIEQFASTDGIARSALRKETDALAVGHLLVGPNPADPIIRFELLKFLCADGFASPNFVQERGTRRRKNGDYLTRRSVDGAHTP